MKSFRFLGLVMCVALMGAFVACDEKEQEKVVVSDDEEVVFPEITVDVPDQPSTPDTPPTPDPEPTTGVENGFAWVDLGTGVRWATMNVGANAPEGYGNYYGWGETETKVSYTEESYAYGGADGYYKYITDSEYGYLGRKDDLTVLEATDDVAHVEWQGNWRMPTKVEMQNLVNNCEWAWATRNNVNGCVVTGTNGNSIFLPAAGFRIETNLEYDGSLGDYWSSELDEDEMFYATTLQFGESFHMCYFYGRRHGLPVRAVCPKN